MGDSPILSLKEELDRLKTFDGRVSLEVSAEEDVKMHRVIRNCHNFTFDCKGDLLAKDISNRLQGYTKVLSIEKSQYL